MELNTLDLTLDKLRAALEKDDLNGAFAVIESLHPADQAELISELDDADQVAIMPRFDAAESADILQEMDDEDAADLFEALPPAQVSSIIDEMEPDRAADILNEVDPEQAEAMLAGSESADEILPLLMHDEDTAGGIMTSEFPALYEGLTVGEAVRWLRNWDPEAANVYDIFTLDGEGALAGVVNIYQMLLADPAKKLSDIMDADVIHVHEGEDQEEVAHIMSRYNLLSLPVVDNDHHMVGLITIDDVMDVVEEEATEDIQRMGGAEPLEGSYLDSGPLSVARKRILWLMLLFITGTLTGSVMRLFEKELEQVVALTFFVPLLIGTGGNAGSQTTSTIIRALAVGDITLRDAFSSLWHEMRVGLILGLGMAVIAFIRAVTWGSGDPLAWTVAIAILLIVIWANTIGSLLPLMAEKIGIDPTIVSGPFMSTLVDATGLLIYFSLAKIILGI